MSGGFEADPWDALRRFTPARIALGRAGAAQPTRDLLGFAMAHAQARDAVRIGLDAERVAAEIEGLGLEVVRIASAAPDRTTYLARPDLGRQLSAASDAAFAARDEEGRISREGRFDLAIMVADGLSSPAIERNAAPLLAALRPWIAAAGWHLAPIALATQARVALGDAVASRLGTEAVLVLIGERPGLSAPDSLGAYLTFGPKPDATTDADRNCLSNIRPEGLSYERAAFQIAWLLDQALRRRVTGIRLKDESDRLIVEGRLPEPALLPSG
ncbi:ethanolamine ammonia-lyase subunit EutC [Enterovirga rhinocerotis]|uniref:Ethanolamine ammonia-lyase small subunit n=1 Tax=Enterovirga rhinocerotis TaxID=1339210 RepID=A0A4R7CAX3_9HYPH|nr:ethanolamine ammonia-lyase subunit EutC [Enterovirga rhinocerotis]TDR95900.1 ethanolamine ammonia-lyase light chain [Enterovirga rhinocerotis]